MAPDGRQQEASSATAQTSKIFLEKAWQDVYSFLKEDWYKNKLTQVEKEKFTNDIMYLMQNFKDAVLDDKKVQSTITGKGKTDFELLCDDEAFLHMKKEKGYTQEGNPFGNFDRVSIILSLYGMPPSITSAYVTLIYVLKHFDAVMLAFTNYETDRTELFDRLKDISVYMKILQLMLRR